MTINLPLTKRIEQILEQMPSDGSVLFHDPKHVLVASSIEDLFALFPVDQVRNLHSNSMYVLNSFVGYYCAWLASTRQTTKRINLSEWANDALASYAGPIDLESILDELSDKLRAAIREIGNYDRIRGDDKTESSSLELRIGYNLKRLAERYGEEGEDIALSYASLTSILIGQCFRERNVAIVKYVQDLKQGNIRNQSEILDKIIGDFEASLKDVFKFIEETAKWVDDTDTPISARDFGEYLEQVTNISALNYKAGMAFGEMAREILKGVCGIGVNVFIEPYYKELVFAAQIYPAIDADFVSGYMEQRRKPDARIEPRLRQKINIVVDMMIKQGEILAGSKEKMFYLLRQQLLHNQNTVGNRKRIWDISTACRLWYAGKQQAESFIAVVNDKSDEQLAGELGYLNRFLEKILAQKVEDKSIERFTSKRRDPPDKSDATLLQINDGQIDLDRRVITLIETDPCHMPTHNDIRVFNYEDLDYYDVLNRRGTFGSLPRLAILDIGCGDGRKGIYAYHRAAMMINERHLIARPNLIFVDNSDDMLNIARRSAYLRGVAYKTLTIDIESDQLKFLDLDLMCMSRTGADHKVVLFLGQTLGNFRDYQGLVSKLSNALDDGDYLILEVDVSKDVKKYIASEDFMFNYIRTLEVEKGDVTYEVLHNERYVVDSDGKIVKVGNESGIEAYFTFTRDVIIKDANGNQFVFSEGDKLHTETSYAFGREKILKDFADNGLRVEDEVVENGSLRVLFRKKTTNAPEVQYPYVTREDLH